VSLIMASTTSALGDETEKDVIPWLKLAEDLRALKLDADVRHRICLFVYNIISYVLIFSRFGHFFFVHESWLVAHASNLCHGRSIIRCVYNII
jgi:hypothetical protein